MPSHLVKPRNEQAKKMADHEGRLKILPIPRAVAEPRVFVLFVQNLAVAARRAACSKVRRFGSFRAISDCTSY